MRARAFGGVWVSGIAGAGHPQPDRYNLTAPLRMLMAAGLVAFGTSLAQAEPRTYPDGHGGEVTFPEGDISFADEVVLYDTGSREPDAHARNPNNALGAPDFANDSGYVSMGCGGELILRLTDNALIDVPGPDLHVFEVGPAVEPTALAISGDGKEWVRIGRIEGGRADVDIGPYVQPGAEFRFVRLVDLESDCGGGTPGADIDAVGAIGSAQRISLDSSVLFATDEYVLMPQASDAIRQAMAGVEPDEVQSLIVAGHTDNVGGADYNQTLSENRARSVAQFLSEQAGFDSARIHTEAWGLTRPIAGNDTAEGRALNRRVEITLRRSASTGTDTSDPVEILGLWRADRIGIVELRDESGKIVGEYTDDNGRIRGRFTSDTVFEGLWIEDDSRERCDRELVGSHHWGQLRIDFSSPDRNDYTARWSYCEEEDWRGDWPPGSRIL